MDSRTKKRIDDLIKDEDSNKESVILIIDKTIEVLDEKFNQSDPHFGLCSVIDNVVSHLHDNGEISFDDESLCWEIQRIAMAKKGQWSMRDGTIVYKQNGGSFMWKPGSLKPRLNFLGEVRSYIIENVA